MGAGAGNRDLHGNADSGTYDRDSDSLTHSVFNRDGYGIGYADGNSNRYAEQYTYPDADTELDNHGYLDGHQHCDANGNCQPNANADTNLDIDEHAYLHAYGHSDRHPDRDADSYPDCHADPQRDGYRYGYRDSRPQRDSDQDSDGDANSVFGLHTSTRKSGFRVGDDKLECSHGLCHPWHRTLPQWLLLPVLGWLQQRR